MPRPRVHIEKQLSKHRKSKAEIEKRTTESVKLGTDKLVIAADVAKDPIAKAQWDRLNQLFKTAAYITSADTESVNRLCRLYSEEAAIKSQIQSGGLAVADIISLHKLIDSKRRLIIKLEESLFLNALVRFRGFPVGKKEEADPLQETPFAGKL